MKISRVSVLAMSLLLSGQLAFAAGMPRALSVQLFTSNNPPDYRLERFVIADENTNLLTATTATLLASPDSKRGFYLPLNMELIPLSQALKFTDDCGYFHLSKELENKAVSLSKNSAGDLNVEAFGSLLKSAHYLAETGRLKSAESIYKNQMQTIEGFGVPTLFRLALRLEYANFLKGTGHIEDAKPLYRSLAESAKTFTFPGSRNRGDEWSLDYPDMQRNFWYYNTTHHWAPPQFGVGEIPPPDAKNPVVIKPAPIYVNEVGAGKDWQPAYRAAQAIDNGDLKQAAALAAKLHILKASPQKINTSLSRIINVAKKYSDKGQDALGSAILTRALSESNQLQSAENRAELLFEVAYLNRSVRSQLQKYWRQFEQNLSGQQNAYYGPISSAETSPQAIEKHLIEYLIAEATVYEALDDPRRSIFTVDQLKNGHKLDQYQNITVGFVLANAYTKLGKFDKTAVQLKQIIDGIDSRSEMANDRGLADSIEFLRLSGDMSLAKTILVERLQKTAQSDEPLNYQLGVINANEKNYLEAESNLRRDLSSPLISSRAKGSVLAALVDVLMAQQKYDQAIAVLVDPANNAVSMASQLRFKKLIDALPHITRPEDETANQIMRLFYDGSPRLSEQGNATATKKLLAIFETKADWPPAMLQTVRESAANNYPEETKQTIAKNTTPAGKMDGLSNYMLIRQGQILMTAGRTDDAVVYILEGLKKGAKVDVQTVSQTLYMLKRFDDIEKILKARVIQNPSQESADLACFYIDQNRPLEAKKLVEAGLQAIAPESQSFQASGLRSALSSYQALQRIAQAYIRHEQFSQAQVLSENILSSQDAWLGKYNSSIVESLKIAAEAAEKSNEPDRVRAINTRLNVITQYLNAHRADGVGDNYDRAVVEAVSKKDWKLARACLELEGEHSKDDEGRFDTATPMINAQLATVSFLQGEKQESQDLLKQISFSKNQEDDFQQHTGKTMIYAACLNALLGNVEEAKLLAGKALKRKMHFYEPARGSIYNAALAAVYKKIGDEKNSQLAAQRAWPQHSWPAVDSSGKPFELIQFLTPYLTN